MSTLSGIFKELYADKLKDFIPDSSRLGELIPESEKPLKFKVGDKVRIIKSNYNSEEYKVGSIITINRAKDNYYTAGSKDYFMELNWVEAIGNEDISSPVVKKVDEGWGF